MKKLVLCGVLAACALLATQSVAMAAKISVANWTQDAWVWVTVYGANRVIIGSYCVAPRVSDSRNVSKSLNDAASAVRVEVTQKNCAHPVMLDRELKAWNGGNFRGDVSGSKGKYTFVQQR
jgi:hypothetical protein